MWHKAIGMGHPLRLELTCVGLLVKLANHYATRGALGSGGRHLVFFILGEKELIFNTGLEGKRKYHASKFLNKLNHPLQPNMLWFFSEEKKFCLYQLVNSQNSCWLALSLRDVPILMKTKHPIYNNGFGVVTKDWWRHASILLSTWPHT